MPSFHSDSNAQRDDWARWEANELRNLQRSLRDTFDAVASKLEKPGELAALKSQVEKDKEARVTYNFEPRANNIFGRLMLSWYKALGAYDHLHFEFTTDREDRVKASAPFKAHQEEMAQRGLKVELAEAGYPWFFHRELLPGFDYQPAKLTLAYSSLKKKPAPGA